MDYTSIHVYGHLLSDDILNAVEKDTTFAGNRTMALIPAYLKPLIMLGAVCATTGVSSKSAPCSMTPMAPVVPVT